MIPTLGYLIIIIIVMRCGRALLSRAAVAPLSFYCVASTTTSAMAGTVGLAW